MNTTVNHQVSIALCTFNGEKFLVKQLESLLSQTYANIEIIAVDDCSSDDTWNIIQSYARKYKRLKAYQNDQNIGYACNFEKAIGLCKGDYIALADQDDIWEKDKIKTLLESIEGCIMVYHNSDFIDEYDRRIGNNTIASKHRMYEGESCLPIIIGNCIHGHSVLFDSKLKNYLFPFNNKFSHDWGIAYVAFNIGVVKYVDKVLVHYRQHQDTVTDFLERRKTGIIPRKPRKLERLSINVSWLKYCSKYKYNKEAALVSEAYTTVSNLKQGKNKFRSLIFLVKYFDLLFYTIGYKPRGFLSKVNFVRKLCFN